MDHLTLARMAEDSYLPPDEFAEVWGSEYEIQYVATEAGLECYTLKKNGTLVFAFRGTKGGQDVLQDLRAVIRATHVWGKAHKGFYDSVQSGWERLLEIAKSAGHAHFYAVGHSKGGGEAVIFASRLEHQILHATHEGIEGHIDEVVTFGSPRAFGPGTARIYKATIGFKTFRYVHCSDPVTLLPFSWRWKHVGQLRWWNGKKWKKRTNWFKWIWKTIRAIPTLRKTGGSHPMKNYVEDQVRLPYPQPTERTAA